MIKVKEIKINFTSNRFQQRLKSENDFYKRKINYKNLIYVSFIIKMRLIKNLLKAKNKIECWSLAFIFEWWFENLNGLVWTFHKIYFEGNN